MPHNQAEIEVLYAELNPIRNLECNCCGSATRGRQWFNRDTGYGMCAECLTLVRTKGMSGPEIKDLYGVEGVHCGVCK